MPVLVSHVCRLTLTRIVHSTLCKHHSCSVWDLLTENNGKGEFPARLKIKVVLEEPGNRRGADEDQWIWDHLRVGSFLRAP